MAQVVLCKESRCLSLLVGCCNCILASHGRTLTHPLAICSMLLQSCSRGGMAVRHGRSMGECGCAGHVFGSAPRTQDMQDMQSLNPLMWHKHTPISATLMSLNISRIVGLNMAVRRTPRKAVQPAASHLAADGPLHQNQILQRILIRLAP